MLKNRIVLRRFEVDSPDGEGQHFGPRRPDGLLLNVWIREQSRPEKKPRLELPPADAKRIRLHRFNLPLQNEPIRASSPAEARPPPTVPDPRCLRPLRPQPACPPVRNER